MKLRFKLFFKFFLFISILAKPALSFCLISSGLWKAPCSRGLEKNQIYKNESVTLIENFHQDPLCADLSFTFETEGQILFPANETHFIDFTYSHIFLNLHKQILIDDFNSRRVCNFDNWQLHVKVEITGLECAIFNFNKKTKIPSTGEQKFGIYLLQNNLLYFGKMTSLNDGSSPSQRPQVIDRTIEYIFQNSL